MDEEATKAEEEWCIDSVFEFERAEVECRIYVRTVTHNINCSRNISMVYLQDGEVVKINRIIAVLDALR